MIEDEATYLQRRALQEQLAAQNASCKVARDRHDELATLYRFRSAMLTTQPRCWADKLQQQAEFAEG